MKICIACNIAKPDYCFAGVGRGTMQACMDCCDPDLKGNSQRYPTEQLRRFARQETHRIYNLTKRREAKTQRRQLTW